MMMKAKFAGICTKCGQAIQVGAEINWERGAGASHAKCPAVVPLYEGKTYEISGGSGYGCDGWHKGEVIRASQRNRGQGFPEWLFVLKATEQYIRDDGLSFGVGDDSGYVYHAVCREATAEEAAPSIAIKEAAQAKRQAAKRLEEIKRTIQDTGTRPEGDNRPEGERMFDTHNIYGGGDWFVVGTTHIWYVRNNGSDGDYWAANNVITGGAGAIGWQIAATEDLTRELRELAAILVD